MNNFDYYHDWAYLADYFDITVTEGEVETVKNQLKAKNLYIRDNEEDPDIWQKLTIDKIALTPYKFDTDIKEDIRLNKLKNKLHQLAIDYSRDAGVDEDEIQAVRDFVRNHAKDSWTCSALFWQAVVDIVDDYTFLKHTAKNLEDLWY